MKYLIIIRRTWLSSPSQTYDHQFIEVTSNAYLLRQQIIDTLARVPRMENDKALVVSLVQVLPL